MGAWNIGGKLGGGRPAGRGCDARGPGTVRPCAGCDEVRVRTMTLCTRQYDLTNMSRTSAFGRSSPVRPDTWGPAPPVAWGVKPPEDRGGTPQSPGVGRWGTWSISYASPVRPER